MVVLLLSRRPKGTCPDCHVTPVYIVEQLTSSNVIAVMSTINHLISIHSKRSIYL